MALEVWALLAAAPCILGWMLGERRGAARMRARMAMAQNEGQPAQASMVPTVSQTPSLHTLVDRAEPIMASSAPEEASRFAERLSEPSESVWSDVKALNAMRDHARDIRLTERIWFNTEVLHEIEAIDAASADVLSHFRDSISELQRANAPVPRKVKSPEPEPAAQRLHNCAPIALRAYIQKLECEPDRPVQPSDSFTRV